MAGHPGSVADDTETGQDPESGPGSRRVSPPLIVALVLGAALVVGIAVAGIVLRNADEATGTAAPPQTRITGPVPLVPVDAPQAGTPGCAALLAKLPATLANASNPLTRRPLAAPAPPASAAWAGQVGDPVVLRCGIERPPELTRTSELLAVDGVNWLRVTGDGAATWYAVDRGVCVALTLPGDVSTGPIQGVSAAITAALPAVPVFGN
jgi:Protein of unknown function (DUF3515)